MDSATLAQTPVFKFATDYEPRLKPVLSPAKYTTQAQSLQQYQQPQVLTISPQHGAEGTAVTVTLQFAPPEKRLKLAFGDFLVDTKQLNNANGGATSLIACAPNFANTGCENTKVPLYVVDFEDDNESVMIGIFSYVETSVKNERKRGLSSYSSPDAYGMSLKRAHTNAYPKEEEAYVTPTSYQQLYQQPYQLQAIQLHQKDYYNEGDDVATTRPIAYTYRQQPPSSAYSYNTTSNINSTGLLGNLTSTEMSPPPMTSPSGPANFFVQTSPPAPALGYMPISGYSYAGFLNKANLKISANMEEMAVNWSQTEAENQRRLVQFWRTLEGNDIHCTFAPVVAADRVPNSIVVSCIYWREKKECFITSVDCILLLESLIGVRFTVEEKNRIRRNLEGFRPQTVSKCKPDSADFFKLIMSFPNPKPRNIEKDVKVFPWSILSAALRKIISKYSASYSSTASINLDAMAGPPYSIGHSSIPSYSYDNSGAIQTSIGSHAPSSLALESSVISQPQNSQSSSARYGNTPSPHHIVASQVPIRSQVALQQSQYDVHYGNQQHLGHHRTPSNSILESPHLSHPSMSPHSVADLPHDPLSPHQLQHYPPSTAAVSATAYTPTLQHPNSGQVYPQYYDAPYPHHPHIHGLHHYGDGGSASEVELQVPKEEPYDASHQPTPQRNMSPIEDDYHHSGEWGTGPADESDVRKAYDSSILYSYDDDATHGHPQAHSRSGRLNEDGDPAGNTKDPDEYVVGQVEE